MRTQTPVADLASERRIRPAIPERGDLVEQRRRPHMRVLREPLADIRLEPVEHVDLGLGPNAGLTFAVQIRPDRLTVPASVSGNGRDRPAPLLQ